MKKFILAVFVTVAIVGNALLIIAGFWSCVDTSEKEAAAARAERAAVLSEPLNEKEAELWAEVYAAAVRRGVWYPAERANSAIIELRKMTGAQE